MYFSYGSYRAALNESAITMQRHDLTSEATGYLYGFEETWTVSGFLQAATTAALMPLIGALEVAFSRGNQPARLIDNDGVTVRRLLPALTPLGGTYVLSGPSYPASGEGDAEWSTFRRYQVVISCRALYPSVPATTLLAFNESLTFTGGGPRFVFRQPLIGLPQRQQVAQSTPYVVTQRGRAVCLGTYPTPPSPIWPEAEHTDRRRVTPDNPKKQGGPVGNVYVEWPIEWEYYFEGASPFVGLPNVLQGI